LVSFGLAQFSNVFNTILNMFRKKTLVTGAAKTADAKTADVAAEAEAAAPEPPALGRTSRIAIVLAFPALAIPVAGWIIAQGFTGRIPRADDWTGAFIHTLTVDVFAVVLFLSVLLNAIIITARTPNRPASYLRFVRLPLSVLLLVSLGLVWIGELVSSRGETTPLEPFTAFAIAVVSVRTFFYARRRDAASALLKRKRKAARAAYLQTMPPDVLARRRALVWYPVSVFVAVVIATGSGAYTAGSVIPVTHRHCEVSAWGNVDNGPAQIDTRGCGTFTFGGPHPLRTVDRALDKSAYLTIVSRGWTLGLPPLQTAISIAAGKG
jgi:hypothetical protein